MYFLACSTFVTPLHHCRYVAQAIKSSQYNTYDINEADVVFVNSYCYYIWWLGWVHTKGREHKETPGEQACCAPA